MLLDEVWLLLNMFLFSVRRRGDWQSGCLRYSASVSDRNRKSDSVTVQFNFILKHDISSMYHVKTSNVLCCESTYQTNWGAYLRVWRNYKVVPCSSSSTLTPPCPLQNVYPDVSLTLSTLMPGLSRFTSFCILFICKQNVLFKINISIMWRKCHSL